VLIAGDWTTTTTIAVAMVLVIGRDASIIRCQCCTSVHQLLPLRSARLPSPDYQVEYCNWTPGGRQWRLFQCVVQTPDWRLLMFPLNGRWQNSTVLSPRGQRGLDTGIFGLCLSLVLVLMQCWPRSHRLEGCPRSLVVSRRNHVIYVTFFSDTLLEEQCVSEV